ncbi:hypothetical protein GS464_20250, partial [Rhodococcus hoagii]|nr:hypothetical protein [Prescottella equi]
MPAPLPANAKKFRYISDYPVDKVIWRNRGSQSIPHAVTITDTVEITIPHGLGFRPLVRGIYSEDNFSNYFEIGNDPWFFNSAFGMWGQRLSAQVYSDSTNVYLVFINFDSTRTLLVLEADWLASI